MTDNGALGASQLVAVQGSLQLAPATARDWLALKAYAKAQGITLTIWTPAGAYRSLATQRDMHARPAAYNLNPNVSLAAVGSSTHGQGRTVDIFGPRAWVKANAPRYGFAQRDATADPDCWVHGGYMTTESPLAGGAYDPLEDDMDTEQARQLKAVYDGLWNGGVNLIDGTYQTFKYGVLPIVVRNQQLIATVQVAVNALAAKSGTSPAEFKAELDAAWDRQKAELFTKIDLESDEIQQAIEALPEGGGSGADLSPILDLLKALPAAVRAELWRGLAPEPSDTTT